MMEPARAGEPAPRAFLHVGGATVARHQLALAVAAGCERIICVAHEMAAELSELEQQAEKAGVRFNVITGPRALSGLITAADELLVVGEGLLPTPGDALRLVAGAASILVLPAETSVPLGFERIDLNYASAGLMLLPGRLVERLNELPADADPASSLLRIALQVGIPQVLVPDDISMGGRWLLLRDEAEAHAAEQAWMNRHTAEPAQSLGRMLARLGVRRFGPALLHAGSGTNAVAVAAFCIALIGLGAGWLGFIAVGLVCCAAGWVIRKAGALLGKIQQDSLGLPTAWVLREFLFDWIIDAIIIALLVMAVQRPEWSLSDRAFAPVMLVGLLRILSPSFPLPWSAWMSDRLVLAVVLAGFIAGGASQIGIQLLSGALLLAGLVAPRAVSGITRA
jgi:hypothetical protein